MRDDRPDGPPDTGDEALPAHARQARPIPRWLAVLMLAIFLSGGALTAWLLVNADLDRADPVTPAVSR